MATDSGPTSMDANLISSLPDDVLYRILGCLETKQAVQTCVLSKWWEYFWTFLSSLCLHDDDFDSDPNDAKGEGGSARFIKFVNKLLQKRKSLDLDVFVLSGDEFRTRYESYRDGYEDHIRREWISYAVKHKARVIYLTDLPYESLPSCIYTCASIEELGLSPCHIDAYEIVHLPNLRKLSIYDGIGCLHNLLSGSPNLEYLKLDLCSFEDYSICHGFLKHLSIKDCDIYDDLRLVVAAPKLLSFSYCSEVPLLSQETLSMPSLVSADIKIDGSQMTKLCEELGPLISALANVEHLKLQFQHCLLMELQGLELPELPTFIKLKNVSVAFCICTSVQMITWILKSVPNLKKLEVQLKRYHGETEASTVESANASSVIENSLCKNLEMVEIKYSGADHMVARFVEALKACTNESENLKIVLSEFKGMPWDA